MSEEQNILTKEIAEQFCKDEEAVDLSTFSAIDDCAAEVLAQHTEYVDLSGLTALSDKAAEILATSQGEIDLSGLQPQSISRSAVKCLAKSSAGIHIGDSWDYGYYFIILRNEYRSDSDDLAWCIQFGSKEDLEKMESEAIEQWRNYEDDEDDDSDDSCTNMLAVQTWTRVDDKKTFLMLGRGYDMEDVLDEFSSEVGKIFKYSIKDE